MADLSLSGLRVLREVAEAGSFSAAADALGYTQSAVSRQVAALEAAAGTRLFERRHDGVRLTPAGGRLLTRAVSVLAELDAARRELEGRPAAAGPVRLGAFASAGAALVPTALAALARSHPGIEVTLREGTTPALVRALRTGAIDLAVLGVRAAVPSVRRRDAARSRSRRSRRPSCAWASAPAIHSPRTTQSSSRSSRDSAGWRAARTPARRCWASGQGSPDGRRSRYVVRDWLTKLGLVAGGLAITTVPDIAAPAVPPTVRLLTVRGEPQELRRAVLARLPGPTTPGTDAVTDALRAAA